MDPSTTECDRVPSLFMQCSVSLRNLVPSLTDFSWLEGVPPHIVERGALLERLPGDLTTLRAVEFSNPDLCELLEPAWQQLCKRKRLTLAPEAEGTRTPWRDLYTNTELQNEEKLERIRDRLKVMNKEERRAKALKRPRLVVVKTHSDTKHHLKAPSLQPPKRLKTKGYRYEPSVPAQSSGAGGAGTQSTAASGSTAAAVKQTATKSLKPFDHNPLWMRPRAPPPATARPAAPTSVRTSAESKQLAKVKAALVEALAPCAKQRAASLASELEKAVSVATAKDKAKYKDQIVNLIMACKDKHSRVAAALASGEVTPREAARMKSQQLLEFKPKMANSRAKAKHKHSNELLLQTGAVNGLEAVQRRL